MTDTKTDLIQDGEELVSARYSGSKVEISTYDDGFGPLWIHRNSIGVSGIVRAQTWEEAYSICEDEFFPEADETLAELVAEYGDKWPENELVIESEAFGFRPTADQAPRWKAEAEACIKNHNLRVYGDKWEAA